MSEMGKLFLMVGLFMVVFGLLLLFAEKLPFGIGRLPGDIVIKRDGFTFYFPVVSSLLLSIFLSLLLSLIFGLLFRR